MTRDPDMTIIVLPACDASGCGASYAETLPSLRRSLASVGDDPAAEVIVVEGLADPAIAAWLGSIGKAERRLVAPGRTPCGPARARNVALASARAPLVAFLQTGDIWCPGKLGPQRALHAGHPDLGFSFTDALQTAEDDSEACGSVLAGWPRFRARNGNRETPFLLGQDTLAQLSAENVVATSTVVARTDLLRAVGGFAADAAPNDAWELWLRLAGRAPVACRPVPTAGIVARHVPERRMAAE